MLAAYLGLLVSVITFGMISVACSSYFQRTAASLVVSYLLILPLALVGVAFWVWFWPESGDFRLLLTVTVLPAVGRGDLRSAVRQHGGAAAASARRGQRRQGSRRPGAGSRSKRWGW